MVELAEAVEKLCNASRKTSCASSNSSESITWPDALVQPAYYFSPELMSLHGSEFWEGLDEVARQRLSLFEVMNFFSLNIHGEKSLVTQIRQHLERGQSEITPYLRHLLDEESTHMFVFARFCKSYGGKVYPVRTIAFPAAEFTPVQEDFLCFARILIFEELVDAYNQAMSNDERLAPIAREINRYHHRDEIRHLAFGRAVTSELYRNLVAKSSESELSSLRAYLNSYLHMTWRTYYNHHAYQDAFPSLSIDQAMTLSETAIRSATASAHRRHMSGRLLAFLLSAGIMEVAPAL